MMTFDEYQKQAKTTDLPYPDPLMGTTISVLGLTGEAGEVADKWKKLLAYKNAKISAEDLKELEKELGDVLWYLAVFADNLGLKLDDIARHNLQKLADRYKRGTLKGAGDNR